MAKENEREKMDVDSDNEDSDEMEDESEAQNLAKLKELDEILRVDPSHYQSHVDKISVLKTMGELEQLRAARETFAKHYPLSPELWLDWLRDEQGLVSTSEEKEKLYDLFDRAVKDYLSVDLWLEYCQFSLSGIGTSEGTAKARNVFDRALTAVGIHVSKGALIWEAYREFESAIMSLSSTDEAKEDIWSRIDKLFRRQLSIPLLDMDQTLEEYKSWLGDKTVDKSVEASFKSARAMLRDHREEFENSLFQASEEPEKQLEVYKTYIEFEKKAGNPARIQILYERRITDQCLVAENWQEYLSYLNNELKSYSVALDVHERSVRNCTWSGALWSSYLRTLEKNNTEMKTIVKVFEKAIATVLASPTDYLMVWLSFIDCKRRSRKKDWSEEEKKAHDESIRELFSKAVSHLADVGGDPDCRIARYWAWFEGDFMGNMEEARKIWTNIAAVMGDKAQIWLEYIALEKSCGDTKHLRKLFVRALEKTKDLPEMIGDAWIQFEREEGTLEDMEEAEKKIETRMVKVQEQRAKEAEKTDGEAKKQQEKVEKKKERDKEKRREKRHAESELKRKRQEEKVPDESATKKAKSDDDSVFKIPGAPVSDFKYPDTQGKVAPPPGFKQPKDDKSGIKGNPADQKLRTVFVSNLDYGVDEELLKTVFSTSGNVIDVRLIKNYAGKSKGYAYIEFEDKLGADRAKIRDHEPLNGRPMFVSEADPDKKVNFKYNTGLEKNKIFVKNIPVNKTKEDVEEFFKEFGEIKDVRIVTYRNGHSKGIAFVEFTNEHSASQAVLKTDGVEMGKKKLSVAISNPPTRGKGNESENAPLSASLGGGSKRSATSAPKSKMAFVPRAVKASKEGESKNGSGGGDEKKSNEDFRQMLLGKK